MKCQVLPVVLCVIPGTLPDPRAPSSSSGDCIITPSFAKEMEEKLGAILRIRHDKLMYYDTVLLVIRQVLPGVLYRRSNA